MRNLAFLYKEEGLFVGEWCCDDAPHQVSRNLRRDGKQLKAALTRAIDGGDVYGASLASWR